MRRRHAATATPVAATPVAATPAAGIRVAGIRVAATLVAGIRAAAIPTALSKTSSPPSRPLSHPGTRGTAARRRGEMAARVCRWKTAPVARALASRAPTAARALPASPEGAMRIEGRAVRREEFPGPGTNSVRRVPRTRSSLIPERTDHGDGPPLSLAPPLLRPASLDAGGETPSRVPFDGPGGA